MRGGGGHHNRRMPVARFLAGRGWCAWAVGLAGALVACTASLDWRQMTGPDGTELLLPCKPERLSRKLPLAGTEVSAQMLVCDAGGATWSVLAAELPDASRRDAALAELRRQLAVNVGHAEADPAGEPFQATGLASTPAARRVHLQGLRPGGAATQADAAFAAQGAWVYQLVVLRGADTARAVDEAALSQFFGGLRRADATGARP